MESGFLSTLAWDVLTHEPLYMTIVFEFLLRFSKRFERKERGAFREVMFWYNVGMSTFSFGISVMMAIGISQIYEQWSLRTNDCEVAMTNWYFQTAVKWFYYSKYVEYMDSVWIVLKGGKVSFLQEFHHAGAPWNMWLLYIYKNESVWVFTFVNSFIHTVMYAYYAAMTKGCRIALKPLLTLSQISQFIFGLYMAAIYIQLPCYRGSPFRVAGWAFTWVYVGVVLVLFLNFFIEDNFGDKKKKKDE